jgi:predicted nucleic acid-binding protein
MTYLLDTCLISESAAPRPNAGVIAWLQATPVTEAYLSALTIGEIKRGIARLPDTHARKQRLNDWLENDVLARFQGRILAIDAAVMLAWGELLGRQGPTPPLMDSLIAAQAIYHRLTLVTRNEKDFHGLGVRILNPWQ